MQDGPESADGSYSYAGKLYRLEEQDSEQWQVFDGDRYLGVVEQSQPLTRDGALYVSHPAGDESLPDVEPTDDWQRALEYLIDRAS